MNKGGISSQILQNFHHDPTEDQLALVEKLGGFLNAHSNNSVLLVKGYAGTGKTSLIASLVRTLPQLKLKSLLLAPTGRAAKVLSGYAKKPAFTIHKVIYYAKTSQGSASFQLKKNLRKNTVFIVDEASMIGDGAVDTSGGNLLDDLLEYISAGENCKLILVGDHAQLPPVKLDISPALNLEYLKNKLFAQPVQASLRDVIRQEKDSGILALATEIRSQIEIEGEEPQIKLHTAGFEDVVVVNGPDLQECLEDSYREEGEKGTIVLCRSNKRANLYNQQIRARIKWLEEEISAGDLLMVVRNNYHWLDADSQAGFIANGDIIEVLSIRGIEEIYGFRFANVIMKMIDYPDQPEIEVKIILDSISTNSANLGYEESNKLYQAVLEDYQHITNKRKRYFAMKEDPYLNALQVKFAYAITCHKSQGGQWEHVYIDQGYLTDEMINREYLRWLYTAMTRAKKKLFFVNFRPKFFEN